MMQCSLAEAERSRAGGQSGGAGETRFRIVDFSDECRFYCA